MRRVVQVTWNWQDAAAAAGAAAPGQRPAALRVAALVPTAVMVVVGFVVQFILGHECPAVWVLASAFLLLGLFWPAGVGHVHRLGRRLGRIVGGLLVYVLLVPFFYLFFFPVACWLRLRRCDPMQRTYRQAQWTYWIPRRPGSADRNYERLFLKEDKEGRDMLRRVHEFGYPDGNERVDKSVAKGFRS